ncbi:MAG: outer membrane protein transport protein, partial [Rhodospirillaceae bacterium]|nr:outer membrane protein transport protein [Rhodospirillaceae bacterium]
KFTVLTAAAVAVFAPFNVAQATNGYFSSGYGVAAKGTAGAGAALKGQDALSGATNPASMVNVGNRVDVGIAAFNPNRSITASLSDASTSTITVGKYKSSRNWFAVPEFGVNTMLDDNTSLGFAMNANGGMNTDYKDAVFRNFQAATTGGSDNAKHTGVDLGQALLGVTYAKKFGNHSVGITPTLAVQYFSAYGLQAFTGISQDSLYVTNNGYDYSAGYGLRAGYRGDLGPLSIGAAVQTRMSMQKFDKYRGLFADGGSFDIPASATLGIGYTVPDSGLSLALDYQMIAYSSVDSVGNSGAGALTTCSGNKKLGGKNGCGFGWNDVHVIKIGGTYEADENLTLRAGGSWNSQSYDNNEILFNILAPAVVRLHASVGATYDFMDNQAVSFAYTRAFDDSITGGHPSNQNGNVKHQMDQNEIAIGYTYKW